MKPFVPGAPGRGGASAHQRVQAAGGPDVDAVQGARREDHDVAGRQREAAAIAEALALACRRARLRTWVSCRADQPHRRSRAARSGCEHAQSESLVISGGGSVACEATLHHTQCLYQHVFFWFHHRFAACARVRRRGLQRTGEDEEELVRGGVRVRRGAVARLKDLDSEGEWHLRRGATALGILAPPLAALCRRFPTFLACSP